MTAKSVVAITTVIMASGCGASAPQATQATRATGAVYCGRERADVKHLTDNFTLPRRPKLATIQQLMNMSPPLVAPDSPRFPQERALVELKNAHVVAAKRENDSDIHIILSDVRGDEMNVESPAASCDASSKYHGLLAKARQQVDNAMPDVASQHYTREDLHAAIVGVVFFDVLHGQRGAPNGVELHPITSFVLR